MSAQADSFIARWSQAEASDRANAQQFLIELADLLEVPRPSNTHSDGRPEIQKFAGALQGFRAKKGIFLTTSDFSRDAQDFANKIDSKIVLIDGETLWNLMIDHGLGVTTVASYEVNRLDNDFFDDES